LLKTIPANGKLKARWLPENEFFRIRDRLRDLGWDEGELRKGLVGIIVVEDDTHIVGFLVSRLAMHCEPAYSETNLDHEPLKKMVEFLDDELKGERGSYFFFANRPAWERVGEKLGFTPLDWKVMRKDL